MNPYPLRVRLNAMKYSPEVSVASVHVHSSYEMRHSLDFTYYSGDVAVLRLASSADTTVLHTACLPYDLHTLNEEDCYVTGNGYLENIGK